MPSDTAKKRREGPVTVGFDLGGTKMLALVLDRNYEVLGSAKAKSEGHKGAHVGLGRMREVIVEAMEDARCELEQIEGIGVGCPGLVDTRAGVLVDAQNLGWKDLPLGEALGERFGCPVVVLNDVDAGTYGEYTHGAGKGSRSLLGVFPGTGVGGGFVYDGRLVVGKRYSCMELGNLVMGAGGLMGDEDGAVVLEDLCSRLAVASAATMAAYRGQAPTVLEGAGFDLSKVKSKVLARAAESDDEVGKILGRAVRYLAMGVASVMNLLAPDRIVLGGGLVEEIPEYFVKRLKREIKRYTMASLMEDVVIVPATLGSRAVGVGAVSYLKGAGRVE